MATDQPLEALSQHHYIYVSSFAEKKKARRASMHRVLFRIISGILKVSKGASRCDLSPLD